MSLGSCEKCWDNPCTCGHQYKHMDPGRRVEQAAAVLGIPRGSEAFRKLKELAKEAGVDS